MSNDYCNSVQICECEFAKSTSSFEQRTDGKIRSKDAWERRSDYSRIIWLETRKGWKRKTEREREREMGVGKRGGGVASLKVLDVRVTCRCHVTRGAVDPRGASSLRTKIAMAAAFWARPAIFQSQPIFPTREPHDTECLTIIRLAAVHLYCTSVLEIHSR